LQRRYPAGSYSVGVSDVILGELEPAVTSSYSSVDLWNDAYIAQPGRLFDKKTEPVLICVATMMQPYKAQDVLLRALRICHDGGLMARVVLVGDGSYRASLERLASRLRIGTYVEFRGALPVGEEIRRVLDSADVFVLPSRVEGLPRALIEAMARGLPCIGSNVGGIPELLSAAEMVPADDPPALAAAISALARDSARMAALSSENWHKALEYRNEVLAPRRRDFYDHIKSITLQHVERNAPAAGISEGNPSRRDGCGGHL
jgi:glycosyltransferase involved in cell wall biosynthesis